MHASSVKGLVYIHADESCLGNQFGDRATPGGAAGLIEEFDPERGWTRHDYYVSEPDTTNNRMALCSAIEGLRLLTRARRLAFYSDSSYLTNGMKDWIHGWAARGWKRKTGQIENLELWIELIRAAARHSIAWRWVRGHAGDPKNEYVNSLATDAARGQKASAGLIKSTFDAWIESEQEKGRCLDFFDVLPQAPFKPDRPPPEPPGARVR